MLQRHPHIALVVTDIGMPGEGDGCVLANFIHRLKPDVPIVVVSGLDVPTDELPRENVLVISKPLRIPSFLQTVKGLVAEPASSGG